MKEITPIEDIENALQFSQVAKKHYFDYWKFSLVSFRESKSIEEHKEIPIIEKALTFISHEYKEIIPQVDSFKIDAEFPGFAYRKGFLKEYLKPFEGDTSTDEGKFWYVIRHIPNRYELPAWNYRGKEIYFGEEKAEEYGVYMARAYKAWEMVANNLPFYEKFFIISPNDVEEETPDYSDLINSLIDADFISRDLKECFIELLTTKALTKILDWTQTDWKLYVIIDKFIEHELLSIKQTEIIDFILLHFKYKNKKFDRKTLRDSIERTKTEQRMKIFTTKLENLLQNKSN